MRLGIRREWIVALWIGVEPLTKNELVANRHLALFSIVQVGHNECLFVGGMTLPCHDIVIFGSFFNHDYKYIVALKNSCVAKTHFTK